MAIQLLSISMRQFNDLEQIKRIEIIKGLAQASYGNQAVGGVINIIIQNLSQKQLIN